MKYRIVFIFLFAMKFVMTISAQSVAVNTTMPDPSAILDVQSTDQGILIPHMTSAQRISIASPASGLMVYDTDAQSFWYYHATSGWINILNVVDGWRTDGNATSSSNFAGTTSNTSLVFKANNTLSGKIDLTGQNTFFGLISGESNT